MASIFVFGSSNAYGVGGSKGGWADMLKEYLHKQMYSDDGIGEKYELYNFAKPGAQISFVRSTFPLQLRDYRRKSKVTVILAVGANNAKAENTPDNFISSIEDFQNEMSLLLTELKTEVDDLIVIGYCPYDERKTLPKSNPLTGGSSYFWNQRTQAFNKSLENICQSMDIKFVPFDISEENWINECLYQDGLHPNDQGHQLIFEKILPLLSLKEY